MKAQLIIDDRILMNIPVSHIAQLVSAFIQKYGIPPNTLLVGPDQPKNLIRAQLVMGLHVKLCDDTTIQVALL